MGTIKAQLGHMRTAPTSICLDGLKLEAALGGAQPGCQAGSHPVELLYAVDGRSWNCGSTFWGF